MNTVINKIANLKTPVDITNFTADRIYNLEKNTPACEISSLGNNSQFYKGYISMDSRIYANRILLPPFYMDDINLYTNFLTFADKNFGLSNINRFDIKTLVILIQMFIEKTFLSPDLRKNDRLDIYDANYSHVSIKDFYGNGSAKCIEKTAAVQNILAFLGIESYLAFNDLSLIYSGVNVNNDQSEGHIINIIRYDGKLWAYDSKNMMTCEKGGKVISLPALLELSENDIKKVREFTMGSSDSAKLYNVEPHKSYRKRRYELY